MRRLTLLRQLTDFGLSIGTVAPLDMRQLEQLVERVISGQSAGAAPLDSEAMPTAEVIDSFLGALARFETHAALGLLRAALKRLGTSSFVQSIVIPLVAALQVDEETASLTRAQRNVARRQLQGLLSGLFPAQETDAQAVRMLIVAPPGHDLELAMGVSSIMAQLQGVRVVNLGAELPWKEVQSAAEGMQPQVMVLSLRRALSPSDRDALTLLVQALQGRVRVWLFRHGHTGADPDDVVPINSYDEFGSALSNVVNEAQAPQSSSSSSRL